MIVLRKEHMKAFATFQKDIFANKLVSHLTKIFPQKIEKLSQKELEETVHAGMEKASNYGMKSEREITLFIDLMFGLGADFDQKEKYHWIVEIFSRIDLANIEKINLIYSRL